MARALAIVVVLAALAAAAPARAELPLRDADYLAFADRVVAGLEPAWDEALGGYVSPRKGATARTNANLLLVFAGAALAGHSGPARHDDRARRIAERMVRTPMLAISNPALPENRARCWRKRLDGGPRDHASLDSQVAEALEWAWRARTALALPPELAAAARDVVDACAHHPQWRDPHALKNQINWNAQLYAAAARATGRGHLLRRDYRRALARFARGIRRPLPGMATTNLGRGYGFHYSPELSASRPSNFDTLEYAHIVATALQYHREARRAGMRALPAAAVADLRRWSTRLLLGGWTHAGYFNWDTGHGLGRQHSGQYWAWGLQGLLMLATAPEFLARPEHARWAKALFDRGLRLYARWGDEAGQALAPQLPFDIVAAHRDQHLYASRMAANALRAIRAGLGAAPSQAPPPFYAFDRETSRLAVSTPAYSTAIVPDNHGAFGYGGIELARLFDGSQRVAATSGGKPPASFGVALRDRLGHTLLDSQAGRPPGARLRLARGRAAAGSFKALAARGSVRRGALRITTTHRFRPRDIDIIWEVRCDASCGAIDVRFPVREAGVALPPALPPALGLPGYELTPLAGLAGAPLRTEQPAPQPTVPHPGATATARLPAGKRVTFAVRLTPRP